MDPKSTSLVSFHGDAACKEFYVNRVQRHRENHDIRRGVIWDGHKGSAVGCTLESTDYGIYPDYIGIPECFASLEDVLFDNMSFDRSVVWPEAFISACQVGVDLVSATAPFMGEVLRSTLSDFDHGVNPIVAGIIRGQIENLERADIKSDNWWTFDNVAPVRAVAWAAEATARVTGGRTESAKVSAWAVGAIQAPAQATLWAAESAAWSGSTVADRDLARTARFDELSNKLLEILERMS